MMLESVRLRNFRLFTDVSCDLHPQLTVFIANNGGGKTSILDAIRILFDTYLSAFSAGKARGIKQSDVRQFKVNGDLYIHAPAYPVEIDGRGKLSSNSPTLQWQRALNTPKGSATVKDARDLAQYATALQARAAQNGGQQDWPLLAYYGTGRLWNHKKLTAQKMFLSGFDSRAAAYLDCMEPASSYKYFVDWFSYAYRSITESKIRYMETTPSASAQEILAHQSAFSPLMSAVQEAVDVVLAPTGWKNLWYSETHASVTAKHDEFGRLPISQLSDGIRNSLGMVADIAFRAVQLNPHLGASAAKETAGIVLIDEVDMHLHPSWQQVFLAKLQEAFPLMQFIVTTHSPQVLTSVDATSIRVLQQHHSVELGTQVTEVRHIDEQTKGVSSADLLAKIMGVDPVPDVPESRMLAEYHGLIQQNLHEEAHARNLRAHLISHFGVNHPVMLECERMIRLQSFKQRLPATPFAPDHQPG
jgi:predicted ATP-binding protein involved in virulence